MALDCRTESESHDLTVGVTSTSSQTTPTLPRPYPGIAISALSLYSTLAESTVKDWLAWSLCVKVYALSISPPLFTPAKSIQMDQIIQSVWSHPHQRSLHKSKYNQLDHCHPLNLNRTQASDNRKRPWKEEIRRPFNCDGRKTKHTLGSHRRSGW